MIRKWLHSRELPVAVLVVVLCIVISALSPSFLTATNIQNILVTNSVLGMMAIGMMIIILTGGIDISVAAMLAFSSVVVGNYLLMPGADPFTVFLVGAGVGTLLGLINALLIVYGKIPPIIATLGTLSVFRGTILHYTNGEWVVGFPEWYGNLATAKILGIPLPFAVFLLIAACCSLLLNFTKLGRQIYAFGGNPDTAERIGINTKRLQLAVYVLMGFITGIAAVFYGSIQGSVQPNAAIGFELSIIAAVVIGGTNVMGGSGTVIGTVFGVLLYAVIHNGLVLARVEAYWQNVVVGVIILTVITVDAVNARRKRQRKAVGA